MKAYCVVWLFVWSTITIQSPAQTIPLSSVQPSRVLNHDLKHNPGLQNMTINLNESQRPALVLPVESEISYPIPAGQNTFSATLIYRPQPIPVPGASSPSYSRILMRVLTDNKVLLEQGMDGTTPPVEFSVPVSGASQLTVATLGQYSGAGFYLADASFTPARLENRRIYLPSPGQGYVDCAPEARQGLAQAYHPDEPVTVSAFFAGTAAQADLHVVVTPEWNHAGSPESDRHFPVSLQPIGQGMVRGSILWKAPSFQGPFRLDVDETVNGQTVFRSEIHAAIGPVVDLAGISDNDFGLQPSVAGFPLVFDEFAGIWGAKWVRIFARWSVVEMNRGQYDFTRLDAQVSILRSQNLRVLLVLGEDAPAWAGLPVGSDYYTAWGRFVAATVGHFAGQIDTWDVFNEVDVKYAAMQGKAERDWDVKVLRTAVETIRATNPRARIVCCSTGTQNWLVYDKRLLDASFFSAVDIVSLHPYQAPAPEIRDGTSSFLEKIAILRDLLGSGGIDKPIWGTEANWLMGPPGVRDVNAPGITEQEQAEYVVRVNLLAASQGVKYFAHSPFYSFYHPYPLVWTWAAYAEMARLFSNATEPKLELQGPQVYEVVARTSSGEVGALWSVEPAKVQLMGGGSYHFLDMYGNPINIPDPNSVAVSAAPLYLVASGEVPRAQVIVQSTTQWRSLPQLSSWTCATGARCTPDTGGRQIQTQAVKYANQLFSTVFPVRSNMCQLVQLQIVMANGSAVVAALDGVSSHLLDNQKVYVQDVPANHPQTVELRFHSGSSNSAKIVIANGNATDTPSVFTVLDRPQIADCH